MKHEKHVIIICGPYTQCQWDRRQKWINDRNVLASWTRMDALIHLVLCQVDKIVAYCDTKN